jgi:Abortive infection C-terminus
MQTVRELIERYSGQHNEFLYYIPIIEKAERNEVEHPDIAIECCSSLFQGIAKSIVYRLDPACDKLAFEDKSLHQQVKAMAILLRVNDDVFEDEFVRNCETLARNIGTLRNNRGDISHGRAVPKELQSDRSLARLVLNLSEGLLRYTLASFFALQPPPDDEIAYDANPDFNDFLDEQYDLGGKPLYSLALYQQYREDYLIRLEVYRDEQEAANV